MFDVICGDSAVVLREYQDECFDFVFADPPFNIGHGYDVYHDSRERDEYLDHILAVIAQCQRVLREGGVFALHVPDDLVELALYAFSNDWPRIDWLIWHYRFGQCQRAKFISSHCHCLIFRNGDKPHTWNPDDILVESDRVSYGDSRVANQNGARVPLDVLCIENNGDCWGRVTGNSAERVPNHPNQLPEKYLELLIRAYTNRGDTILDPYGGTGTTAVVADALGRCGVTIDVSAQYCADIETRLTKGAVRVCGKQF